MQLLNLLIYAKIRFYMYKLQAGEVLVLHNNNYQSNYIILNGCLLFSKHFTNNKIISIGLLSNKDIIIPFFHNTFNTNYFYQAQALCTTYLISYSSTSKQKFLEIIKPQYDNQQHYLLEILAHRNAKQRLIHTLLIFAKLYGTINNKRFEINLNISYDILSFITGNNKNTISTLIQQLIKHNLIIYSKNKIIINNLINLIEF